MVKVPSISIVDDDGSIRESLHSFLRSVGFIVEAFASAGDFLGSKHLAKSDCLILDVHMPGMTGIELSRQTTVQAAKIPIIFITADEDEGIRAQALEGGAVAFLVKPLSEEVVLAALDRALKPD